MTVPDLVAETVVAASVDTVWALISDPTAMSRWSPEVVAVRRGPGPVGVGTRTLNLNRRGPVVWPTSSAVVRYDPPRAIAWRVAASGAVWSLEPRPGELPGTTRLVHRRTVPPTRPLVARLFAPLVGGVAGHDRELAAGMHHTLAAIAADLHP